MNIRTLDSTVAGFLVALGLYLIWSGWGYGFMRGTTPGPGFFPALIGFVMAVLSCLNLMRSLAGQEKLSPGLASADVARVSLLVLGVTAVIALADTLGLTLSAVLLIAAASLIIRPRIDGAQAVKIALVAIAVPLACRWLFGGVLNMPLPTGPFGL